MKHTTLEDQLKINKGVRLWFGDKIIIESSPNCISSSISIEYSCNFFNAMDEHIALSNNIQSWNFLKWCSEQEKVNVMYQEWDKDGENCNFIPFKESIPYRYRFDNDFKRKFDMGMA